MGHQLVFLCVHINLLVLFPQNYQMSQNDDHSHIILIYHDDKTLRVTNRNLIQQVLLEPVLFDCELEVVELTIRNYLR